MSGGSPHYEEKFDSSGPIHPHGLLLDPQEEHTHSMDESIIINHASSCIIWSIPWSQKKNNKHKTFTKKIKKKTTSQLSMYLFYFCFAFLFSGEEENPIVCVCVLFDILFPFLSAAMAMSFDFSPQSIAQHLHDIAAFLKLHRCLWSAHVVEFFQVFSCSTKSRLKCVCYAPSSSFFLFLFKIRGFVNQWNAQDRLWEDINTKWWEDLQCASIQDLLSLPSGKVQVFFSFFMILF